MGRRATDITGVSMETKYSPRRSCSGNY